MAAREDSRKEVAEQRTGHLVGGIATWGDTVVGTAKVDIGTGVARYRVAAKVVATAWVEGLVIGSEGSEVMPHRVDAFPLK